MDIIKTKQIDNKIILELEIDVKELEKYKLKIGQEINIIPDAN